MLEMRVCATLLERMYSLGILSQHYRVAIRHELEEKDVDKLSRLDFNLKANTQDRWLRSESTMATGAERCSATVWKYMGSPLHRVSGSMARQEV